MANRWTLNEEHLNVDNYLKACVNLYGYVTPRQFLKLYNRFNTPKINKEKFLRWAERLENHSYLYYRIYSNAVVNGRVSQARMNEIAHYQSGKKYYNPEKEELLKYSSPTYYEKNEYTEDLRDYLIHRMHVNKLVAEAYISRLVWMFRTEEPLQDIKTLTENCGIEIKSARRLNVLADKWQNINNNTRKWANCGYTPTEIVKTY